MAFFISGDDVRGQAARPVCLYFSEPMHTRPGPLRAGWFACAPLPALIVGIVTMRQLGVSTVAWSINVAATAVGLLLWRVSRRLPPPKGRGVLAFVAVCSIATILLPFVTDGMLGVYRWIPVAGFRLHASAIAAPLIIWCVAAAASHGIDTALAIGVTGAVILALQPDAGQTTSFAAACAVILVRERAAQTRRVLAGVALLAVVSIVSFVRHDPLPAVAHVEGIFDAAVSRGAAWAATATAALLLLPVPFFAAWQRQRSATALALGVYVAMTVLAPAWGTFPVPVMGHGASPILGYFLALAVGSGGPSRPGDVPGVTSASSSSA